MQMADVAAAPHGSGKSLEEVVRMNTALKALLEGSPGLLSTVLQSECTDTLRRTLAFSRVCESGLRQIASVCERKVFAEGDHIVHAGDTLDAAYVIVTGQVRRREEDLSEVALTLETATAGLRLSIGTLSLHSADPLQTQYPRDAVCSTAVVAYRIDAAKYRDLLRQHPALAIGVIESVSTHINKSDAIPRTALLAQQARPVPTAVTALAAVLEAGYRLMAHVLHTHRFATPADLPKASSQMERASAAAGNIAVTTGARAVFIFAAKRLRETFAGGPEASTAAQIGAAVAPGVVLAPLSGWLEARRKAGPWAAPRMRTDWSHGFCARAVRDGLFTLGMNQLSDFFEERCPSDWDPTVRVVAGSAASGVVVGYATHIPHMLCSMKLRYPTCTYSDLFQRYAREAEGRLPKQLPPRLSGPAAAALAVLMPTGVVSRCAQLVVTFGLVNGVLQMVSGRT
eukprot:TRINITY_DN36216_c0_g1_i1.p1 TRINITY_DN36216_c0_g1~~TRINITY_DN36216_c0_g1_i1.p1  ORF type:complete len:456 (+),score=131.53 TRINITY_DN36216_c0_g1_i1:59-1426(+)